MFKHWFGRPSRQNRQVPQGRDGETATRSPTDRPLDARPDLGDVAGDLMAEDHRLLQPDRAETAMVIVVQIRAADAADGERHADFAGSGRSRFRRFDPEVFGVVNDDGAHGASFFFDIRRCEPSGGLCFSSRDRIAASFERRPRRPSAG